jgi:hypothetical protein
MGRPAKQKLDLKVSRSIQKRCREALEAALKGDGRRYLPRKAPDGRFSMVEVVTLPYALNAHGAKYAMKAESLRKALGDEDHPLSVERAQSLLDTLLGANVLDMRLFAQLSAEIRRPDDLCFLIGDPVPRVLAEMRERHPRLSKTVLCDIKEALNTALNSLTLPLSEEHRKVLPGWPVHRGSDVYTLSEIGGAVAAALPEEGDPGEWMRPFQPQQRTFITGFRIQSRKSRAPKGNGGID